jgi:hypothetical protein
LTASARLSNLPSSSFAIAGASPFATLRPAGLATLRLRLRKEAMPAAIAALEARLPPGVSLGTTGAALARVLTGNVALFAHAVRVDSGLRTPEARFFALRFAALAETSEPAQVAQVLGQLDRRSLRRRGGSVELGLSGSTLWLANEPTARAAALAALGPPSGVQGHAVELSANPSAVARAMAQVPLFEAVQSPELAVLLAIATELGPALLHSASVTGWADPGPRSTARAQLTWVVEPPEPPEPAGDLAPASRREPQ